LSRWRRPDPRRIKIHRAYTIEELARALRCHKNSVRLWLKQGLVALNDGQRPLLIHGSTARKFLEERRRASKRTCLGNQLFCLACKEPRTPDPHTAGCRTISNKCAMLTAPCPRCTTRMFKIVSVAAIAAVKDRPDQESGRTLKQAA